MLNTHAITKIQSAILICVIVVAAVGGTIAYVLLNGEATSETIKIGIFADLDYTPYILQGALLAAEQLNEQGGILGRQVEVIGEDNDIASGPDPTIANSALTRLLTHHNVDFIIGISGPQGFMVQDLIAQHTKIYFEIGSAEDEYTQRVVDDYDSYKYYFRIAFNETTIFQGITEGLVHLREQTGFNKVGYMGEDVIFGGVMEDLDYALPELGFDLVYKGAFPIGTVDFTSYFAAAESAGVEVVLPLIVLDEAVAFVKEYHDRQSPMLVYGGALGAGVNGPEGWEITGGKCEYISAVAQPIIVGYPITAKTVSDREAYISRWDEIPYGNGAQAYDIIRYILSDAIERAGTVEVNAVIQALETTSIETSLARNFVFTESHDLMSGENPNDPDADYMLVLLFQWVDGKLVPVYPKKIMEEAGATITYPDWNGPWKE